MVPFPSTSAWESNKVCYMSRTRNSLIKMMTFAHVATIYRTDQLFSNRVGNKKDQRYYRFHQLFHFRLRKLSTKFWKTSLQLFKSDCPTVICVHRFEHFLQANDFLLRKIFCNYLKKTEKLLHSETGTLPLELVGGGFDSVGQISSLSLLAHHSSKKIGFFIEHGFFKVFFCVLLWLSPFNTKHLILFFFFQSSRYRCNKSLRDCNKGIFYLQSNLFELVHCPELLHSC